MRVAIYCRVSTAQQDDEGQHQELLGLCGRAGWEVVHSYRETASGTKGTDQRPELRQLLVAARQRKFDMVAVWSADRLGRSMRHLVNVLHELHSCNVALFSFRQGVDTSTPMGAMLWQFLGIFAEFEHGIRRERQAVGIAKAREKGVKFGRPPISALKRQEILVLRGQGLGINRIARQLRVGSGAVIATLKANGQSTSQIRAPITTTEGLNNGSIIHIPPPKLQASKVHF